MVLRAPPKPRARTLAEHPHAHGGRAAASPPRGGRRALLLLLLLVALTGCIKKPQTVKLAQPAKVRAAYVLTYPDRPDVDPVPEAVASAIERTLGARNLQPRAVDVAGLSEPFARKRATQDRLEILAAQAAGAGDPFVLLVETTARYYSLLSGRYRWNVYVKVTLAPTSELSEAQSQTHDLAAFLDFGHQDEVDALEYQSKAIADRVGRIADQFLTGLDGAVQLSSPRTPHPRSPRELADEPRSKPHPLQEQSAIYFVMVDRFHNGEPSNDEDADPSDPQAFHGGDLQGLEEKLSWIDGLGVSAIWLSPIFEMREKKFHGHGAFHGYWVEDFGEIEDRFGGEKALRSLRKALRKRGMSVLLDVVVNHVGMDTPLVRKRPQWFHNRGGITDWNDPVQILTHDVHGLPDLAVEKPDVYEFLLRHSLRWVEAVEPAGFRLDAVKHVPNDFWTKYNAAIKARAGPDFVMLGEHLDGDPSNVARTMREGRFDAMFDFPLHFALVDVFCRDAHPGRLASTLYADRLYPDAVGPHREGLVTLLDNHDLPRILSACGNEPDRVVDALKFMLTARGTPSFTWGTESGARGLQEPDNRSDMRFEMHPVGEAMVRWLTLREEHDVFTTGEDRLLMLDETAFAYLRSSREGSAVVAFNRGAPRAVTLPGVSNVKWTNVATNVASTTLQAAPGVTAWVTEEGVDLPADGEAEIEFDVDGAPEGDLRVAGSGPELGNWDPTKAPRPDGLSLPDGAAFAYKLVVVESDGSVEWQDGDNHYLLVDGARTVRVEW